MILQALYDLYERISRDPGYEVAPWGYSLQKITFCIVLKPDGTLFDIQDARLPDEKGKMRPRQLLVPGSTKSSGSGLNPGFLWDNTAYMLGFRADDPKPDRTRRAFEAFRERHLNLQNEIDCPAFSAVCEFLRAWQPETAVDFPVLAEAGRTGFGVFQIRGQTAYVHDDPIVRTWWEEHAAATDPKAPLGQCLLTGRVAPIARLHGKIRGVVGGKADMALVSFNDPAYKSYGKDQSFNAPVSEEAAFRYSTALSAILDGPKQHRHRILIGDATVAFWTERPTVTEDIFARFLAEGDALLDSANAARQEDAQDEALRSRIHAFLDALRKGRHAAADIDDDPEHVRFYILGLSPNAARIAVRFFHQGTLGELVENLHRHFQDIALRPPGRKSGENRHEFPSARLLLRQTAREDKDIPPVLAGPFLKAIITGQPYPEAMFSAVIRRIRAGDPVSYLRCCVIKGYLVRNQKKEIAMSLDPTRTDPPYLLGRLFAALEKTQQDAHRKQLKKPTATLNSTIRDRFYSAASATPGVVFPRLLRTYQHHLAKIEGGLKVNREKLVQEIIAALDEFPARLTLPEQGMFAIGYYHQMQDFYTRKEDRTNPEEE